MKYFLGFVVGSVVVSALTFPARHKAFREALGMQEEPKPAAKK